MGNEEWLNEQADAQIRQSANPISNKFAGIRSERERHIEIITRALASVAIMEKGTFTAAVTKKAVLNGAFPTVVM